MRRPLVLLFCAPLPLAACATSHYDDVVRLAASKHARGCSAPYAIAKLNGWGYRVDACEGTLYYRCSYQRKSMGRTQCCHQVADSSAATALVSPSDPTAETCIEFVD